MKFIDWTLRGVYPDDVEDTTLSFYGRRGVVPGGYSPYPAGTIRADVTQITTPGGCDMVCYAINTYAYQWETSRDGTNYTKMEGERTNELSQFYPHITGAGGYHYYRCICRGFMGESTTEPVKISVTYHAPIVHIISNKTIVTAPNSITFTVNSSQYATAYQWMKDGVEIPGATGTSYTANYGYGDGGTFTYTCVATGLGGSVTSNEIEVTVHEPAPEITIVSDKTEVTIPGGVIITATTQYADSYQWFENGSAITGATGASYPRLYGYGESGIYVYKCEVTGLGGTATSNEVVVLVNDPTP